MRVPCGPCRRLHEEPACTERRRSVNVCITLPAHLADRLDRHLGTAQRSRWIARAVERALDQGVRP